MGWRDPSGSGATSFRRVLRYKIHAFRGRRIFCPVLGSTIGSSSESMVTRSSSAARLVAWELLLVLAYDSMSDCGERGVYARLRSLFLVVQRAARR